VKPLRLEVLRFVTAVLRRASTGHPMMRRLEPAMVRPAALSEKRSPQTEGVRSGIDELSVQGFDPLSGLRVGLITNHTGLDSKGRRTLDLLSNASNLKLTALFSPEHGLNGNVDVAVPSSMELVTKLPVHSLYGDVRRPTREMLEGLDALVFDIQDAGVRFYTYITTMAYAMEAAAKKGLRFYVLDRPNPINAAVVQGPVLEAELKSFTGYHPLPVRHGMTVGELAGLFNQEANIGVRLQIVKMQHYRRGSWYDETGLPWVAPSPNLRTLRAAVLYPGVALVEGANVSVGRGTEGPFELLGAPWIDGDELAAYLNQRNIAGVSFTATRFTPSGSRFKDSECAGVRVWVSNRARLDSPALGVEIASALHRLYKGKFRLDQTIGLVGARWVVQAVKDGWDPRAIVRRWQATTDDFLKLRDKYLLYRPREAS
jgi:uncharacterized protein YbbC (DUF1343 family)